MVCYPNEVNDKLDYINKRLRALKEQRMTISISNSSDYIYDSPKRNYKLPVMLLDAFTKVWCIDRTKEELEFMCDQCPFECDDQTCSVKLFKSKFMPDYEDFGSMGDL